MNLKKELSSAAGERDAVSSAREVLETERHALLLTMALKKADADGLEEKLREYERALEAAEKSLEEAKEAHMKQRQELGKVRRLNPNP